MRKYPVRYLKCVKNDDEWKVLIPGKENAETVFKVSINLARKKKRKILPCSIFSTGFIRDDTEKLNSTYIMACVIPSTIGRNIFLDAEI